MYSEKTAARRKVIRSALFLAASEIYADDHPEDPSGDWDCEYKEDMLDEAIKEYNDARDLHFPSTQAQPA